MVRPRVAVLGAGIQGCCLALELAARGAVVDLVEAGPVPMDGASRHTEGKIHLGFVYANDPSLRTAELMARGALAFLPLLRRWVGAAVATVPVSRPFTYAVHRRSLRTPDELEATYGLIADRLRRLDPGGAYFGEAEPHRVDRLGAEDPRDYAPSITAAFATREIAVAPDGVADLLAKAVLDAADVRLLTAHRVVGVDPRERTVEAFAGGAGAGTARLGPYDHVANCTWGGRPAIDATAGLSPPGPWTFRLKHFVRLRRPDGTPPVPSTTVVLGPFGDIVDYGHGEHFLSWYPVGRTGWSTDLVPPAWPARPDEPEAARIGAETLARLAEEVAPALAGWAAAGPPLDVRGGLIYSLGRSDVDDPASRFHERSATGVFTAAGGCYHSIDTGKYTTAPLFAEAAARRILDGEP